MGTFASMQVQGDRHARNVELNEIRRPPDATAPMRRYRRGPPPSFGATAVLTLNQASMNVSWFAVP